MSLDQAIEAFDDASSFGAAIALYRAASQAYKNREITEEEFQAITNRCAVYLGGDHAS